MPKINFTQPKLPWKASLPKSNDSWGKDTGFYAKKAWRNLRAAKLREDPLCIQCKAKGQLISATVVDHIIPRRANPDLELSWDNLQSLCESCHNTKSAKEGRGGRNLKKRP
jgi:5-methylcytosine-specific restriction enzyme A